MTGIATCPFCQTINRFLIKRQSFGNVKRCSHLQKLEKSIVKSLYVDDYDIRYFAVFREEQEEIKVLIEEESNESNQD